MARPIAEQNEAVLTESETQSGTAFIKNHMNEIIHLPDGRTYKFLHPRETITDEKLVKSLKAVSKKYGIIVVGE